MYKMTDKIPCVSNIRYKSMLESNWFPILSFLHKNGAVAPRILDKAKYGHFRTQHVKSRILIAYIPLFFSFLLF